MELKIVDFEKAEPEALAAATARALYLSNNAEECTIYVNARVPTDALPYMNPGWLEYLIITKYGEGRYLTVGMIERSAGVGFEFHS
jgi:hypothetical protein